MFGTSDMRRTLRKFAEAQFRLWAGFAFMALAMASIQYDETIAPSVDRLSNAWTSATTDFSRTLASFTL